MERLTELEIFFPADIPGEEFTERLSPSARPDVQKCFVALAIATVVHRIAVGDVAPSQAPAILEESLRDMLADVAGFVPEEAVTDALIRLNPILQGHKSMTTTQFAELAPSYDLLALDLAARAVASQHTIKTREHATAIIYANLSDFSAPNMSDVIKVVVGALPLPVQSTTWEQIVEFKKDDDAQRALRRLWRWMNQVTRRATSQHEISDELHELLDGYEEHMRLHRLKTTRGKLEAVVTAAADIIDDIARLHFGRAARALFALTHQRVELLEAEQKAPGRSVAFIAKAQAALGNSKM